MRPTSRAGSAGSHAPPAKPIAIAAPSGRSDEMHAAMRSVVDTRRETAVEGGQRGVARSVRKHLGESCSTSVRQAGVAFGENLAVEPGPHTSVHGGLRRR